MLRRRLNRVRKPARCLIGRLCDMVEGVFARGGQSLGETGTAGFQCCVNILGNPGHPRAGIVEATIESLNGFVEAHEDTLPRLLKQTAHRIGMITEPRHHTLSSFLDGFGNAIAGIIELSGDVRGRPVHCVAALVNTVEQVRADLRDTVCEGSIDPTQTLDDRRAGGRYLLADFTARLSDLLTNMVTGLQHLFIDTLAHRLQSLDAFMTGLAQLADECRAHSVELAGHFVMHLSDVGACFARDFHESIRASAHAPADLLAGGIDSPDNILIGVGNCPGGLTNRLRDRLATLVHLAGEILPHLFHIAGKVELYFADRPRRV